MKSRSCIGRNVSSLAIVAAISATVLGLPATPAHADQTYVDGNKTQFESIYIEQDGNSQSVNDQALSDTINQSAVYSESKPDGWQDTDEGKCYWKDGKKLIGIQTIEGNDYLFNSNGFLVIGWGIDPNTGRWCFATSNGQLAKGWLKQGGYWYLLGQDHLMLTGWQSVEGSTYYLDESGAMRTGWQKIGGGWFWLGISGRLHTGWIKSDAYWYWLDPDESGKAAQNCTVTISGTRYAFDDSCHMAASQWQEIEGNWYLADSSGALKTSWVKSNGTWYYLDPIDGHMYTGVNEISGATYLFDKTGAMAKDWMFFERNWYLADSSGTLQRGWQLKDSNWYYLDPISFAMETGEIETAGKFYYLKTNGSMIDNEWITQGNICKWYGPDGARTATISDLSVTFESGMTESGLVKVGDTWYYLEENQIQIGDREINGTLHHFDNKTGAAIKGWQHASDGSWTYNNSQGVQQTGWIKDGSLWYYLDTSGIMATGWIKLDGAWYLLNSSGAMLTGWQFESGTWYYINSSGVMQTGWQLVSGSWYYMNGSGAMQTGWIKLKGTWYYLDPTSGYMHTGWTWDGNSYYWLNEDGSLGNLKCTWTDMFTRAQSYYSNTNWLILTDTSGCRTAIYYGHHGAWRPVHEWACSSGKPSSPTLTGEYTVTGKGYSFGHGYTCYYYTQFCGDYLFHSVPYYQNTFNVMDGRLGIRLSAGCIRLTIENAKWIYDNIPIGTKIVNW